MEVAGRIRMPCRSCCRPPWLLPSLRTLIHPCNRPLSLPSSSSLSSFSSSSSSSSVCRGSAVKLRTKPQPPALTQKASLELSRKRWLTALSPSEHESEERAGTQESGEDPVEENEDLIMPFSAHEGRPSARGCVLGIDPDVSGALAVIRSDDLETAEVFDVPSVHVIVGSQNRRRHDARSIADLLKKLDAPPGSIAYLEQSMPLPKDGKQGWWGSGFGFGIWIGSLVASGFTVVPVPSAVWKRAMEVSGAKDNSRESASLLFPALSSQLMRKKDHGRAEALLIAAYGKGISPPSRDVNTLITDSRLLTPL